jgi:hypothetical protein
MSYLCADEGLKTSCPFSLHLVLDLVKVPESLLRELEEEIQRPAGIWTVHPPPMSISGLLMSKECGILYEFHKTEGVGSVIHAIFSCFLFSLLRPQVTFVVPQTHNL